MYIEGVFLNEGVTTIFDGELDLIIACYSGKKMLGKYVSSVKIRESVARLNGWHIDLNLNDEHDLQIDNSWNPIYLYEKCKTFKQIIENRNELLINNDIKLNMVIEVMKQNPVPTIVFNESIDFVERLTEKLNENNIKAVAYHSKIQSRPLINPATGKYFITKTTGKVKIFGKN